LARLRLFGSVITGTGQGAAFTQLPWVRKSFVATLGIDPFPGTLNLKIEDEGALERWKDLKTRPGIPVLPPPDSEFCRARCYPVRLAGGARAAIVCPDVPDYPEDEIELIAPVSLRESLNVVDGDRLELEVIEA
jgi:CTP-dependent riboflavin kinase